MKWIKFSDEIIHLQQELTNGYHNKLCEELAKIPEFEDRLAHIATHCEVLVDGTFSAKEINAVCNKLTDKLITLRQNGAGIIVVRNPH